MKALTLTAIGGLEHLKLQELPKPSISSPGDVLVRIRAAALNRIDLWVVEGLPGQGPSLPHIVGSDAAGVVEEVGAQVWQVRPGDRVMLNPGISCGRCAACLEAEESLCSTFRILGEHVGGTLAEYVIVPAENLAPVPTTMSWAQAAAFSLATLTAWRMLATRARLRSGETVLIWGSGGGVSQAALQISVLMGARAIVTGGSPAKLGAARRLGAAETLVHSESDVVSEVRRMTDGRGADVVVDSVGERTWTNSLRALRRGGRLVICGATTGPSASFDLRRLFWHQWSILGSTMGNRREYAEIVRLAHQGKLVPVVDRVVPLDEGPAAFARMQRGEQSGKLVIEVSP
ncbi:MAG TPA: zinc-binding dehydrogenase [Gemmatimonadales bacterium]|jgi:NADPH:quinone reductase-like Zn-dependent oxidoreductase